MKIPELVLIGIVSLKTRNMCGALGQNQMVINETQTTVFTIGCTIGSSFYIHRGQNEYFYSKELRKVKKKKKRLAVVRPGV